MSRGALAVPQGGGVSHGAKTGPGRPPAGLHPAATSHQGLDPEAGGGTGRETPLPPPGTLQLSQGGLKKKNHLTCAAGIYCTGDTNQLHGDRVRED